MNNSAQPPSDELWRDLFGDHGSRPSLSVLLKEAKARNRSRALRRNLVCVAAATVLIALGWLVLPRTNPIVQDAPIAKEEIIPVLVEKGIADSRTGPKDQKRETTDTALPKKSPEEKTQVVQNNEKPHLHIPGVREITDEELLERLRGIPVALVGPKGHRKVLFLNEVAHHQGSTLGHTQKPSEEPDPDPIREWE